MLAIGAGEEEHCIAWVIALVFSNSSNDLCGQACGVPHIAHTNKEVRWRVESFSAASYAETDDRTARIVEHTGRT